MDDSLYRTHFASIRSGSTEYIVCEGHCHDKLLLLILQYIMKCDAKSDSKLWISVSKSPILFIIWQLNVS